MACEQVEIASVSFLRFIANKDANGAAANYSFVLRGYVRHWLTNVWSEFDRIKLTDLVGVGKNMGIERKPSLSSLAAPFSQSLRGPSTFLLLSVPVVIVGAMDQ